MTTISVTPAMMIAPTVRGGSTASGTATESSEAATDAALASRPGRLELLGAGVVGALELDSGGWLSPRLGSLVVSRNSARSGVLASSSRAPSVLENEYF